jgi:hypothetical protein
MTFFIAKHAVVLAAILLAAAGAGTLALGPCRGIALRSALGMALWGQALFLLAAIGQLRAGPILVLMLIAYAGGALRSLAPLRGERVARERRVRGDACRMAPLIRRFAAPSPRARGEGLLAAALLAATFTLALFPPIAFDETLYHLPIVRALAGSGQLRFLADMRFPLFPQIQELLCVPPFLFAGDVATHMVSLAEVLIAAALLYEWHPLAAAIFVGSPIVIQLGTITYVDAALTLFVAAGFYCLERDELALAGLFLGTACGTKYLGGYFAVAALVILLVRRRNVAGFAACGLAAALPTTLWLLVTTHDPVFPFLGSSAWSLSFPPVTWQERVVRTLRLAWDVTFARERVNAQPPITPFLIPALLASRRYALLIAGFVIVFAFLPQDSRYLVPLLPLISVAAATRWPRWTAAIAAAPGLLYCVYVLAVRGLPPADREAWLTKRVPEYAALMRAGSERVYVCGGEQLKYYAKGELLGDHNGPYSFDRILTGDVAKNLRRIDARYFLVAKRACRLPRPGMELVYEDAAAQLWRVQRSQASP